MASKGVRKVLVFTLQKIAKWTYGAKKNVGAFFFLKRSEVP